MLSIPYISLPHLNAFDANILQLFSTMPAYNIKCCNWEQEFPYTPEVKVKIAQTDSLILLQYQVQENCIRAKYTQANGKVWTDSCVEVFISLDNKKTYYNCEFNCIGTPLISYNTKPREGQRAKPEILSKILTHSTLGNKLIPLQNGSFNWTLTIAIPYTCFFAHRIDNLKGKKISANFYKCGDELTIPHFLSMFPIATRNPNFHCPEYFCELQF
ncbi:MAG: carbohydrate-binding family 9-like protein [Bacteroidales bacterium]